MESAILRLLDANANRAREGMRVAEDYARFVLNSDGLTGEIKHLRHELAEVLQPWLAEAVLHRDTPGDVGTGIKTSGELSRVNVEEVVIAAGKRVGEALRAIEEFLKIEAMAGEKLAASPFISPAIEGLRYRWYEIERKLALTLHPENRFANVRLYVLITESACANGDAMTTAQAAIEGGADALQLREKGLPDGELLNRAKTLVALCRKNNVLCIINDRPDIAVLADADGVHLGQDDLPAAETRRIVGARRIVGVSTHNLDQAQQAVESGADYIGVGPVFRSSTKPRDILPGLEYAAQAARQIAIPKVAIAGITAQNIRQVVTAGIRAVAVTAAVTGQTDVRSAAAALKNLLTQT